MQSKLSSGWIIDSIFLSYEVNEISEVFSDHQLERYIFGQELACCFAQESVKSNHMLR